MQKVGARIDGVNLLYLLSEHAGIEARSCRQMTGRTRRRMPLNSPDESSDSPGIYRVAFGYLNGR
jgi:hypothetical protein